VTKPVIAVNVNCIDLDETGNTIFAIAEFSEWYDRAIEHFKVIIYYHKDSLPEAPFLTIDRRSYQFRGDWSAWWLQPKTLAKFKDFTEGQEPCKEAGD
jgi:hypothetical protein